MKTTSTIVTAAVLCHFLFACEHQDATNRILSGADDSTLATAWAELPAGKTAAAMSSSARGMGWFRKGPDSLYLNEGEDGRFYFLVDTTTILIQWNPERLISGSGSLAAKYPNLGVSHGSPVDGFIWYSLVGEYSYTTLVREFRASRDMNRVNEVLYRKWQDMLDSITVNIFIGDEISCQFKETTSRLYINSVLRRFGLDIVSDDYWEQNQFMLRIRPESPLTTLEAAHKLAALREVDWAGPNYAGGAVLD